jgi:hypothetical protein
LHEYVGGRFDGAVRFFVPRGSGVYHRRDNARAALICFVIIVTGNPSSATPENGTTLQCVETSGSGTYTYALHKPMIA